GGGDRGSQRGGPCGARALGCCGIGGRAMQQILTRLFEEHQLITAFAAVGGVMYLSYAISKYLTFGRVHGSAIAIVIGLALAYVGGVMTGGKTGVADIPMFA